MLRTLVMPISTAVYPYASQKAVESEHSVIRFVEKYALLFAAPFLAAGFLLIAPIQVARIFKAVSAVRSSLLLSIFKLVRTYFFGHQPLLLLHFFFW